MKKSKEGSTLMVTIIIFMFVTTVSVAFLSMITSNYYARVSENKRTQNLYGSESGLDTTYNIISKTVEAASAYGNGKVEEVKKAKDMEFNDYKDLINQSEDLDKLDKLDKAALYALYADIEYWKYYNGNLEENENPKDQVTIDNHIKTDNEDIDKLINKVFKNGYKKFIQNKLKDSIEDSKYIVITKNPDNGTLVETEEALKIPDNAKIYMGKKATNTNVQEDINLPINDSGNNVLTPEPVGDPIKVDRTLKVESGYNADGKITYDSYSLQLSFYNEEDYPLTITSEFETNANEENTVKVGENLRIIEANYSLRVPNYNEVAFKASSAEINNVDDIVGLTIGGDMDVKGVNILNVTGDIFVQGKDFNGTINNQNRTFEKYSGGIRLDNASGIKKTINFNNNVFTRGTFNLKSNVDVNIKGDIYARNIYAGNGNDLSDNSTLTVSKEAVIDNDLSVKATNTKINITDFYGINDKNIDDSTKPRKSSSIIINDYKTNETNQSSVKISNKAYIMGVAHINTQDGYQTGESVAVKGNYKAYGGIVDPTEKFIYDDPLQVLDEDNVLKKADHFYKYWKTSGDNSIDCGGVTLPGDTYSIGAILNSGDDKVRSASSNISEVETTIIQPKRLAYARNVYTLGQNNITDTNALNLYDSIGVNAQTVSNLLGKLGTESDNEPGNLTDSDYKFKSNISYTNNGQGMAIFAPKEKTVVIKGANFSKDYTGDAYVVIDATSNKNLDAVIVTAGNVIIDGEVNFRGNIIAQGDLTILGNSTVNIYYDKNVTQDIQKSNGYIFRKVFGNNFGGEELNDESLNIQSNSSNFLKSKLWKIIQ